MANLGNAWTWGQQKPVLGSQINSGHPLAKSLVGCWLLNEQSGSPVDLVTTMRGSSGTSYVPGAGPAGYGRMMTAVDGYTAATVPFNKNRDLSTTGNQWTISRLVRGATFGAGGKAALFAQWSGSSTTEANIFIYYVNSTTISVDIPFVVNVVNATGFTFGTTERITVTRNGSAWTVYRNNVAVATASSASSSVAISTVATYLNKQPASDACDWKGTDYGAQMWRRCFSPQEVAWLSAEPYAFIKGPGY